MRLLSFSLLFIFASMLCASPVRIKARDDGLHISKQHRWKRSTQQSSMNMNLAALPPHTPSPPPSYSEAISNSEHQPSTCVHDCAHNNVEKAWRDRGDRIPYGRRWNVYALKEPFYDKTAVITAIHVNVGDSTRLEEALEQILLLDIVHQLIAWGRYDGTSGTDFVIVTKRMGDPAPAALDWHAQEWLRRMGTDRYRKNHHVQIDLLFDDNSYFAFQHSNPGHSHYPQNDYTACPMYFGHATYVGPQPKPKLHIRPQQIREPIYH